jgi:MFS superfamily sulfate permease-like transporter
MAVSSVAMSISMAALVFAGPLAAGLPRAVASESADSFSQVFVLIGIATLTTGLIMLLMGQFKLGHLGRYIPNTVVAAFIAGTGWLLLKGGFDVMVGYGIEMGNLSELFASGALKFWIPGLVLGAIIWLANIITSPLGSLPAFHALGDTVLAERLGARTRLMPMIAGGIAFSFGVFGLSIAGYMPRMVVGGLLISVGIALFLLSATVALTPLGELDRGLSTAAALITRQTRLTTSPVTLTGSWCTKSRGTSSLARSHHLKRRQTCS